MIDSINSFENSAYNKRFQALLKQRRQSYMNSIETITKVVKRKMNTMMLTKEELKEQLVIVINHKFVNDESEAYIKREFIAKEKYKLFLDFIQTMAAWHFYLKSYAEVEDFELCCQIRDAIKIEVSIFYARLKTYCPTFSNPSDKELIDDIITETRLIYNL